MGSPELRTEQAAETLLAEATADPFGHTSPSIYETARLITLAPWLVGHEQRLRFLLDAQRPDGGWGGPDGYGLVPTLSATEALVATLRRPGGAAVDRLVPAADRGLRVLFEWLGADGGLAVPDTIAVEIIVPALVADINTHLDGLAAEPVPGLDAWRGTARLPPPGGMDHEQLSRLRDTVRQGRPLPPKLWHTLEVIGPEVAGASFVDPVGGAVACSPAATAAWCGPLAPGKTTPSVGYLETLQERYGGPVPVGAPVNILERAWTLSTVVSAGLSPRLPAGLVDSLHGAFGELGAHVGPGLTPDVDDTATALYALALVDSRRSPECLWHYWEDSHFATFPAERNPSTTSNAHALLALGASLDHEPARRAHYEDAMGKVSAWLRDCQRADGSWSDKWHASPYYATACCAKALAEYGGRESMPAVRRAVAWVTANQRDDGSWGYWQGTHEETAYAIQVLLGAGKSLVDAEAVRRAALGCGFLRRRPEDEEYPPLWHDKDLYTPFRVVRAEVLAALHLGRSAPDVDEFVEDWEPVLG